MSVDLRDLYQEVILDHYRSPRNFGPLDAPTHTARGANPLCGDRVTVALEIDGDTVRDVRFEGAGCAISTASASLMTELVKGRPVAAAERLVTAFHDMMTGEGEPEEALEPVTPLQGVREFPIRVKCATLAWHTLLAALADERKGEPVTTE